MIRDRLKRAARRAALKAFGMEEQAEERDKSWHAETQVVSDADLDRSVIPKVMAGSGDTPGPNHKTQIGRTWVAAQLTAGVPPFFVDIRSPEECAGGVLPGAILLPGEQLKTRLDVLPEQNIRVTIYDQTGGNDSDTLAAWLREQGWGLSRQLKGGYLEWVENKELIDLPEPPEGGQFRVGDAVKLTDGNTGRVQKASAGPTYTILKDDGAVIETDEDGIER